MDELIARFLSALHAIWVRRWIALGIAWIVALIGAIGVGLFHDRYEATARIYVDTQTVLKPLMSGLAYQPDIDQQVGMLARTLISRPNIERLLESPQLSLGVLAEATRERTVDKLMTAIKVSPTGTNLYSITYRDTDPQRAEKLVQGLVALFVESGVGGKRRDSEEARRFIDEQISTYEAKLLEAETRLKEFKRRNFGLTGTSNQDYFAHISSLSDVVAKLRVDLSAAEQARDALKRELAAEDPQLPIGSMVNGQPIAPSEIDSRIEVQKRQLDELLRRYTDEHPDVVATRRTLGQLEAQKKQDLDSGRSKGRGSAATSPVYQKIRISLADAEATVASLRTQLGVQQARLESTRADAGKMPEVEAELVQLNRDYDVLRKNYEQLVARRESASLGVKIDQSAHLADFRIVEPPRVSPKPVFPNRLVLAALTLVFALAVGVGVAFGWSQVFPTVHVPKDLGQLAGRPVLGAISMYANPAFQLKQRRDLKLFTTATVALIVLYTAWMALLIWHAGPHL